MGIARDSPLPLYHQLKQLLLQKIESGAWKPGDLIPGEQELQNTYGLSRTTVRQGLRELEVLGRISRHRGRGTFVSGPKVAHSADPEVNLSGSLRAQGVDPGWALLSSRLVPAPVEVAAHLGIATGASVFRLSRLRLAGADPIGVHVAHVAPAYAHLIDAEAFERGGSLDYLRAAPILDGAQAERILESVPCLAEDSERLDLDEGAPVLRIRRTLVSVRGEPIEHLIATYRGDRFQYQLTSPVRRGAVAP